MTSIPIDSDFMQNCDNKLDIENQTNYLEGVVIKTEEFASVNDIDFLDIDEIKKENVDFDDNFDEYTEANIQGNIEEHSDKSQSSSGASSEHNAPTKSPKKEIQNAASALSPYETYKQYCIKCDTYFIRKKNKVLKRCGQCCSTLVFECTVCERRYKRASNVSSHLKTKYDCRDRPDLHCCYCDYTNIHKGYMKNHMLKKHGGGPDDLAACSKCGRHFKRRYNAEEHELSCGGKPYIECLFCDFQTTYKVSFKVHMNNHIIDPSEGAALVDENFEVVNLDPVLRKHYLRKCDRRERRKQDNVKDVKPPLMNKKIIDLHCRNLIRMFCYKCKTSRVARVCKPSDCIECKISLLHECGLCKSKFNTYENLLRHLAARHDQLDAFNTYICANCDRRYDSFKKLTRHENFCQRSYKCCLCPFAARTQGALKRHREKWHIGPLRTQHQPCQRCGRQMRSTQHVHTTNICSACLFGQTRGFQARPDGSVEFS